MCSWSQRVGPKINVQDCHELQLSMYNQLKPQHLTLHEDCIHFEAAASSHHNKLDLIGAAVCVTRDISPSHAAKRKDSFVHHFINKAKE